ncbi:hypothetical protein [Commensalibacter nepenthis]|uniref:PEGA domain-containing protein n=1 Tax=Commensalibacter nepenthis TaxID=3043872 RepID=A0ABT6Q5J3_9PROT|nr:hypothetical protein [Commensalibacter sp. TBRC 10068]MDI2112152.1 hypothetical protein [Commensalibacter sp. TBRC 10068]
MKRILPLLFANILILSGCASIVGSSKQNISINSNPDKASYVISDNKGNIIAQGETPSSVSLEKSDGSYFGGIQYTVTLSKAGYNDIKYQLKTSPNGWYYLGNLGFGGLIGWFAVDPFSSKMYKIRPKTLNQELTPINPNTPTPEPIIQTIA